MPTIFRFENAGENQSKYLTLEKIADGQAVFRVPEMAAAVTISYDALAAQFKGRVYIAWKNHLGFKGTLPFTYPKGSVIMLKMMLRDMGYDDVALTPEYDQRTKAIVKEIQQRHGIEADGFVGPLTKIVLYNEKGDYATPQLVVYEPLLNDHS